MFKVRFAVFSWALLNRKVQRNMFERSFDRVVGCWESSQTHVTFQRVATRLVPCCGNILRILQCNSSGRVAPNEQYISHHLENKKNFNTAENYV